MRVCFIEDTDLHGGTQIWVTEATRTFFEAGLDVTVLTSESGWVAEECRKTEAKVVTYDYNGVVARGAGDRKIWAEALRESDVAVCTVHPPRKGFHCSVFAAEVIDDFNLPTILVPKTGTIVPEYKREFYRPAVDINYHVVAITDFTRKYLVDNYGIPSDKVSLVYQGANVDLFAAGDKRDVEARKRYPLPRGASPVLGSLGSFEHRKGQVLLLEAVSRLRKGFPSVHAIFVGDGPDEKMLKHKTAEMGLGENVSFFPFTSAPVFAFEVIDILVLPSLYKEGLPNVLLEAMAMELPVVASNLAGVPEIVINGETGYMMAPGDVDGLVDAVTKLWSDREKCAQIGRNGSRLITSRFNKTRQFRAFMDFFEKLVRNRDSC